VERERALRGQLAVAVAEARQVVPGGGGARSGEPPDIFCDPITHELMADPVTTAAGNTYERSAIVRWLRTGRGTDPLTNAALANDVLVPNHLIRGQIIAWKECSQRAT
jgi:hypothetical protein